MMMSASRSDVIGDPFANLLMVMRRRAESANSTGSAMSRSGQVAARSCLVTMSVMVISKERSIDRLQQIGWAVGQTGRDTAESARALRTLEPVNRQAMPARGLAPVQRGGGGAAVAAGDGKASVERLSRCSSLVGCEEFGAHISGVMVR